MKFKKDMGYISGMIDNNKISTYILKVLMDNQGRIKYKKSDSIGYYNKETDWIAVPRLAFHLKDEEYINPSLSTSRCYHIMVLIHEIIHHEQNNVSVEKLDRLTIAIDLSDGSLNKVIHRNAYLEESIKMDDYINERLKFAENSIEKMPVYFEIYMLLNCYGLNRESCILFDELEGVLEQFIDLTEEVK